MGNFEFDLVLRGGTIVDGTGDEAYAGDLAILDGVIAALGVVSGRGREELDATSCIVTPGFVDIHTHYDGQITGATGSRATSIARRQMTQAPSGSAHHQATRLAGSQPRK